MGTPNAPKFHKNPCCKSTCFQIRFFMDFGPILLPKINPKSIVLQVVEANRDFVKIIVFPKEILIFFRFGPSQNRRKFDLKRHSKKSTQKSRLNIDLRLVLGSENHPKTDPRRVCNELGFATRCNSPANRNKPAQTGGLRLSPWLLI